MPEHRLLVLDAGSVATNNFTRAVQSVDGSFAMIGCGAERFTLQRSIAQRNYLVPKTGKALVAALNRIIRSERIELVIANSDADVAFLSGFRERLACRTFLPAPDIIETCRDKFTLMALLRASGISVPPTYAVERLDQLDELFRRLSRHSQVWCRIRRGSGSIGAIPVRRAEQARWWIEYWQEMRGVPEGMFTLSEYLPGRDITVQCIFRRGKLYIAKMLHRLSYNVIGGGPSGISSTASLGRMIYEPRILRLCERAITCLDVKADGAFSVDLRENADGRPCITEINAGRFANGPVVHDLAGEPSTVLTYVRLALGQRVKALRGRPYPDDHYVMRHLDTLPQVVRAADLPQRVRQLEERATRRAVVRRQSTRKKP